MSETPEHPDRSTSPAPEPSAFHILVVDDEEDVRTVLCDLIGADGYRVTGAANGREALKILKEESVDLVLTDLMMPDMSGWQLLRAVKKAYDHIPVIVITGFVSDHGESMLTDTEAEAYLIKPIDHSRLQALLKALLFSRNLGRPAEVVVIDDDPDALLAIEHALHERGLFTATFQDPARASQHIREHPPDLVIVDLLFPGASGFDTCQSLRSDPDTAFTPILILTAHPSRENVQKAVQLNVSGFIAKPFDPKELAERVLQLILRADRNPE